MAFKVIIIGGGLAGSLLGAGLLEKNIDFTLYERDPIDTSREGYQIRLGESALTGFRACLPPAQIAKIEAKFGQNAGRSSTAPIILDSKFRDVLDLSALPTYTTSYAINRVVLRNLLIEPIVEAGKVQFGKTFSQYRIITSGGENNKVEVLFEDGTQDVADLLIGADGSGSKINYQVGARNLVPLEDWAVFVAKGSLPVELLQTLPPRLMKGPFITFTKSAAFYYALYLPSRSPGVKSMTDDQLDYDENTASFYWGLNMLRKDFADTDVSSSDARRMVCNEFLRKNSWSPEFNKLINIGQRGDVVVSMVPLRASKKLSRTWRVDLQKDQRSEGALGHVQVWLLGDAAHAMQPNRGMGGNQALHDCADILPRIVELSDKMNKGIGPSTTDYELACKQYEGAMIERAFLWVQKSGGTSTGALDLDGLLGTMVWLAGVLVVPVVSLAYRLFGTQR